MPTRHRGPEKEVRALNTLITLLRAAESVTARLQGRLGEASVTVGQFGALEALYHLGPMRPNELARKLLRSPGNMTTSSTTWRGAAWRPAAKRTTAAA